MRIAELTCWLNTTRRHTLSSLALAVCVLIAIPPAISPSHAQTLRFHVEAGAFDRLGTAVNVALPLPLQQGVYPLKDESGNIIPLQVDARNRAWINPGRMPAGTSKNFHLELEDDSASFAPDDFARAVGVVLEEQTLQIVAGGRPVLRYFHGFNSPPETLDERYRRGGYIHPVFSPSGEVLTNHLNVDQHPHHAGIWSAWTRTEFDGRRPDFWNVHQNRGRVDADSLLMYWQGPVVGGFRATHRFIDLSADTPVTALNEMWEVRVYAVDTHQDVHVFDLEVTQTTNTNQPLFLPEYHYGGIGFRGNKAWDNPENLTFLTAEGLGRDGHATRSRWAHMGGLIGDQVAGMAILNHSSNYRFPQPMRIHPSEPFFNYAPTQLGDMHILPGVPYVTNLRIVTFDGEVDPTLIDHLWKEYVYPPSIQVTILTP